MHVLVMTVVHHPEDARILHRQIRALVDAGHEVTYAAPYTARGVMPRSWVNGVDLPRAAERRRLSAVWAARKLFKSMRGSVDLALIHDPELLLAVTGVRNRPPVVWDVHEDTPATLSLKPWLPAFLRPPMRFLARLLEGTAERRLHLLLAETAYAGRFKQVHLVVPNETWVPDTVSPPGDDRVVYLGWLSEARGVREAVEVARLLQPHRVAVELIGYADPQSRPVLNDAVARGLLEWRDFMPNDEALKRLDGALAGLSLLHDEPNYRHSMPTKIIEYMAHGIPVITTPSPRAVELVERYQCGVVVSWQDPDAVAQAVLRLRNDAAERRATGARGYAAARANHHWPSSARRFVAQLEAWGGVKNR
ncbi:glycosyltransferase [Sphaerimonospora sp. CA-214678]|uniref:glycosyltransferase n=1 Tax=Sphaerimonospora sp. CA-214678 TaxID=3240029 RepID=UPI003D936777